MRSTSEIRACGVSGVVCPGFPQYWYFITLSHLVCGCSWWDWSARIIKREDSKRWLPSLKTRYDFTRYWLFCLLLLVVTLSLYRGQYPQPPLFSQLASGTERNSPVHHWHPGLHLAEPANCCPCVCPGGIVALPVINLWYKNKSEYRL